MKRTIIFLLLLAGSSLLTAAQTSTPLQTSVVQGVVVRNGTNEPVPDVQISLEGAVSPEKMQALLRDTASAGISINPPAGASLAETTQMLISTAAARGLPIQAQGIQNLVTRAVGNQTWPTATTDRDGRFTFRDVQ